MSEKNYSINYTNNQSEESADITDINRPISPHIQIYKWEWTMLYSIMHRASAAGVGIIGLMFPFIGIDIMLLMGDYIIAKIICIAMIFCIGHYIFATIKYMIWGFGKGLDLKSAKLLGHISLVCTILFTVGFFIIYSGGFYYLQRGLLLWYT